MRTEYSVSDMTIHRIVEQEQGFTPMLEFLPTLGKETLEENLSWLAPGGYNRDTGNVVLCYQSYVVKTPHHNILVDACIGNDKNAPQRPAWNRKNDPHWMNALKAAGLGVEDIDFDAKHVLLREKKRSRERETFRTVDMTPTVESVMREYFATVHPGGAFAFCRPPCVQR